MSFFFITLVIALKFVVPALMLYFPFASLWANYILDVVDGDILQYLGMSDMNYQTVDKTADYVSYIFMLLLGMRWRIKKTVIALFIYRTIGQILFFLTRNELFFFYFQNFLEPLMMIYALILLFQKDESKAYRVYKKYFFLIWAIIIAYKVWNEWYLHFANIDLSTMFFGIDGANIR
ncbi:hypothetical protein IPM65_01775 [Candidatus Roizmanbacteria bacterium]|nr:MAG: hypothetical protein IPM65_01775 [Candidatus Roizmanbacteria bacterium]